RACARARSRVGVYQRTPAVDAARRTFRDGHLERDAPADVAIREGAGGLPPLRGTNEPGEGHSAGDRDRAPGGQTAGDLCEDQRSGRAGVLRAPGSARAVEGRARVALPAAPGETPRAVRGSSGYAVPDLVA